MGAQISDSLSNQSYKRLRRSRILTASWSRILMKTLSWWTFFGPTPRERMAMDLPDACPQASTCNLAARSPHETSFEIFKCSSFRMFSRRLASFLWLDSVSTIQVWPWCLEELHGVQRAKDDASFPRSEGSGLQVWSWRSISIDYGLLCAQLRD